MKYLLDTSALLVFYRKEPEVDRVLTLFEDSQNDVLLCALSVAEFGRRLRELGQLHLVHRDKHMAAIPPEVLPTLNLAQS
ncbi:MAG: hypothetical protein EA420_16095 [Candidatus Competibacteraceae bacterium]|nr:MAG: hypothetical protein EA420_16095 [Candidatus Competibacteraceae bacterium]